MQRLFSKALVAGACLLLAGDGRAEWPDRQPLADRAATLQFTTIRLSPQAGGGIMLTGAWQVTGDDPRVMGLSALAMLPGERLQALSDSGVLVTFAKPSSDAPAPARVSELADGPGYPTFKKYRDSEAMIVAADGRGRLIAFENRHSLWRYAADGGGEAVPLRLPSAGWKANSGIEAMVRDPRDNALLLLHEGGRRLLRVGEASRIEQLPLEGATGGIADAVRLPDGRVVVAVREVGFRGLANRLAWLEPIGRGYRLRNFATLPLGALDNIEGLAAEQGPDGGTILWAVTDNDGWRRTLLLRMTLDTTKAPAAAGA